jgi:2-polyprenyl-3-methyl-5-hydroxy-6-metoxy-1,4-benzoquinol methylase
MSKVSVNLEQPSPYLESDSYLHRLKRKFTYRFALNAIQKRFLKSSTFSMLELGTGSGFFLLSMHEVFPSARLSGIEFDDRLLEATQIRAPFAKTWQGNVELFEIPGEKFDVITSFQVIEHLYKPELMIDQVLHHLKPGGLFIFTTPNLTGFGAKLMGSKWHGYRDDHVSMKGAHQWVDLLKLHGFLPVSVGSTFFSGIPWLNRLPLGIFNWTLLLFFGYAPWMRGESFVGVFTLPKEGV